MLPKLTGPAYRPANGGKPRRLVILLHGVGADGMDLIGLAPQWAPLVPDAAFVAPDAPFPCDMGPQGYQWFSLQDLNMAAIHAGVRAAAPFLETFIDDAMEQRGFGPGDIALVGFSQGAMMALYTALRRPQPVAGIIGYSGALVGAEVLPQEIRSRPPVLLVHGDADPVIPFQALAAAEQSLKSVGVPVETLACPGTGHGIDEAGLEAGGRFLQRVLGGTTGEPAID